MRPRSLKIIRGSHNRRDTVCPARICNFRRKGSSGICNMDYYSCRLQSCRVLCFFSFDFSSFHMVYLHYNRNKS